jgi:Carboxypeptidase regulatory-like domain
MTKFFQYCFFLLILFNRSSNVFAQGQRFLTVKGYVADKDTRVPLSGAVVSLSYEGRQLRSVTTNSFGNFSIDSVPNNMSITVQISQDDYTPFSQAYSMQTNKAVYDIGSIFIEHIVHIVSTSTFVLDNLTHNQILATEGAKELFYTLNPELRNQDEVQSNYKIKLPAFPAIDRSEEKNFNNEFKKVKNQNNPDVFMPNRNLPGRDVSNILSWRGSAASYKNDQKLHFSLSDPESDKPEKFVFVIWKKDADGNAILKGPEVEKRFLVYYYGSYKEGDTSLYHKADDATYGYATMWNASYKIIIVDKILHKEVKISDPVIETSTYFNRKDLFTLLNVHLNWIKIPIQIFD